MAVEVFCTLLLKPLLGNLALALRTVAIAARVVEHMGDIAVRAVIMAGTQICGLALSDGEQTAPRLRSICTQVWRDENACRFIASHHKIQLPP
ncbi:MAG: hypothetical protein OXI60_05255 [Acidiferrobacterales bacterium]|nr:hypothetical protein [Acidiferrobacterales bacterium]